MRWRKAVKRVPYRSPMKPLPLVEALEQRGFGLRGDTAQQCYWADEGAQVWERPHSPLALPRQRGPGATAQLACTLLVTEQVQSAQAHRPASPVQHATLSASVSVDTLVESPWEISNWTQLVTLIQLSLAILNPSVPWNIVQYTQRFGLEGVLSPGKTVRYIQRFGKEGVRYSKRQLCHQSIPKRQHAMLKKSPVRSGWPYWYICAMALNSVVTLFTSYKGGLCGSLWIDFTSRCNVSTWNRNECFFGRRNWYVGWLLYTVEAVTAL